MKFAREAMHARVSPGQICRDRGLSVVKEPTGVVDQQVITSERESSNMLVTLGE